jgi:hypothetical protein
MAFCCVHDPQFKAFRTNRMPAFFLQSNWPVWACAEVGQANRASRVHHTLFQRGRVPHARGESVQAPQHATPQGITMTPPDSVRNDTGRRQDAGHKQRSHTRRRAIEVHVRCHG